MSKPNRGKSPNESSDNSPETAKQAPAPVDHVAKSFAEAEQSEGVASVGVQPGKPVVEETQSLPGRLKTVLIGKPRDLADTSIFHHISLIAFLAWVGLGADGLSSSCYGPPEAFKYLGQHAYLAGFLALAITATVFIIATCYSHIIEEFPSGGGGYLVASKLLGNKVGVISGCALLVDYVLTITVSIAAAGEAICGLLGSFGATWALEIKLPAECAAIVILIILNLRGVRESVQVLLPIFLLFLATHFILIVGSLALNFSAAGDVTREITAKVNESLANPKVGWLGMFSVLLYAYSMGAGTYTGLEAVSNSMPVMREPRVATAKRTMRYMAFSLAFMAGGLIVAYLLLRIRPQENVTMNQVLTTRFLEELGLGGWAGTTFLWATLFSEGLLLIVGAQAGFIDGPRVLANMAHDSWMPRWFANLSERLATHNGVLLMGIAALTAMIYSHGSIDILVTMYSINVFVTFSLSMIGMCRHWWQLRDTNPLWRRRLALFALGAVLCMAILSGVIYEKLFEGGWVTIAITGALVGLCFFVHRYYRQVGARLRQLDEALRHLPATGEPNLAQPDPTQPTAVILVGGFSGIGIHTMLNTVRFAPNYYRSFIFISVGVIDSGNFKGSDAVDELRKHTVDSLEKYCDLARRLGMPSASYMTIGTDAVDDLERLCREVAQKFPKATFFAGQLVFQKDSWMHRLLHNQTAWSLQRRLQWTGLPMVILPTRVR